MWLFDTLVHSPHLTDKTEGRRMSRTQICFYGQYRGKDAHVSISLWEPRNSENSKNLKFQSLIKKFETIWSNRFLVSIHSHGARLPGSCPGSIIYCCVTLGKLLDFSMPQFPYLWNGNNNSKLDKVFVRIVRYEFTKNWNVQ